MDAASIVTTLERGFNIGPICFGARAANGELYKTFSVSARLQDGQPDDALDDILSDALVASVMRVFPAWGPEPWLYWRKKPEFEVGPQGETRARSLRCRVLISRTPPAEGCIRIFGAEETA